MKSLETPLKHFMKTLMIKIYIEDYESHLDLKETSCEDEVHLHEEDTSVATTFSILDKGW